MGTSSSVSKKGMKSKNTNLEENEKSKNQDDKAIGVVSNSQVKKKSIIRIESERKIQHNNNNINSRDGDSQEQDDRNSLKQQNQRETDKQGSLSELNEDQNVHSKQDFISRSASKAQFTNIINGNSNLKGSKNLQQQNSYRSPSYVQFQREHYYNHKIPQPNQNEKRLFGDFYTGNPQTTPDKNIQTYYANNNHEDVFTIINKVESQKKKDLLSDQIKEKKSTTIETESNHIVEIKERNQNFFSKGNVVLAVNQFNNYKNEKIQNQEEHQSQLLKQLVELGIQPTTYILNNSIKVEYEEKKNQLSKYEDYGAKNQRNKNAQKVQIITYPGFQEMLQNKNNNQSQNLKLILS